MNIKKLVSILFTILGMTAGSIGQQLTDVQQLELEDGLLDRIVNKVHRDTFGYFYLFFDQGIQQYDGKNFKNVNTVQLNNIDLSMVDHVTRSKNGGIQFQLGKKAFLIDPGSTLAQPTDFPKQERSLNISEGVKSFQINGQQYLAQHGSIWTVNNNEKNKIFGEGKSALNCQLLKRDGEGNYIAFFGFRLRTTEKIIVIRNDGTFEDFSYLLNYSNNIRDVYCDNIDSKWLMATFNGIFIYNYAEQGIDNFYVRPDLKKSQFGNIITGINTETDKTVFLKETYGLRELNQEDQVNLLFENKPEYFHRNQKLIYDRFNNVFYSYSYDAKSDFELYKFNVESEKIDLDYIPLRIRDIFNLDAEHILIAGHSQYNEKDNLSGSLYKYHKTKKSFENIIKDIPAVRNLQYIKETQEYWLGTQYGIYIYDNNFDFKEALDANVNLGEKYIPHPEIRTMYELEDLVIVGTYKAGIYLIDKNTKHVTKNISEYHGLSDNAIAGIIEDNEKNVWISTFNGLTILNSQLEIIQKIYEYDGLPNREFNTKAIAKDKEGQLYFGTLNGLVRIDPKSVLNRKTTQGIHLSKLDVFYKDQRQSFSDLHTPVSVYNNFDSIRVNVNYPDYYRYRFDNWSSSLLLNENADKLSVNSNSISIPHLPTGEYNFDFTNSTNNNRQSLELNIERDLRRILGITALALLSFTVFFLFLKYRIDQLKKFEEEKTKINTKIAELELTALRSQMNPHFIFNALGSVQYFIQTQETEKADSYLSNFAKLMRKILESSKSKFISLQEEIKLIELYVGLEKMRFEQMFDFNLIVDPDIDLENPLPPMVIQPFVENAINHGLHNLTTRKGQLDIHFKYIDEEHMQCIITDNGIGRQAANKKQKSNHKSRGLEIVKDRVNTINSQSDIKLHIKTIDLHNGKNPIGTQVILNIEYDD